MWYIVLFAALLGADQLIKLWTVEHLALGQSQAFWPGLMQLTRVHNYGAAWSSFSGQRWLLLAVTACIVLGVLYALVRRIVRHPLGLAACFLILSGGIGNIIDRARLGYVVDMFQFEFWQSYPVFNVADICVVCGCVLGAVWYLWFYEKYDKKDAKDGSSDAPTE